MNYLITFDSYEVLSVMPLTDDTEVLGGSEKIISSINMAKIMLAAAGIDITELNNYVEQNPE